MTTQEQQSADSASSVPSLPTGSGSKRKRRKLQHSRTKLVAMLDDARARLADLPQVRAERDYWRRRCRELEALTERLREEG